MPAHSAEMSAVEQNGVTFKTPEGMALRGTPVRIQRHAVIFELHNPLAIPRLTEALADFKIIMHGREIYSGRAVITNIVDAGTMTICSVALDLLDWVDLDLLLVFRQGEAENEIKTFLNEWQKNYSIVERFKIAVADMQSFFYDLQLLLDRMELRFQAQSQPYRQNAEVNMVSQLARAILPLIDFFFEKFDEATRQIPEDEKSAHINYMRQHLYPLILIAPFANHTITKPRGYAGDYEMVNMIDRNGFEGKSLFAKVLHACFVQQPPAQAHRNRIKYLADCIEAEAHRVSRTMKRPARIYNFACGPAIEVQRFARNSMFASEAEFTLEDFDDHALAHCRSSLLHIFNKRQLDIMVNFKKKSIYQLLKESQSPPPASQKPFDLVYCAGLFDYVAETTCRQMIEIFYNLLAPGGLLIATNVNSTNPLRYGMECLLDWHLIYRNEAEMRALVPKASAHENVRVRVDDTGVNLFLEIRKPDND